MDRGQQLIETGPQSGTSNEAVTVQPEAIAVGETELIGHYYPSRVQEATLAGESDEC